MARIGFCGGTYQSQSVNADAQRTINFYPEVVESDAGKTRMAMYQRPGLVVGWTLPGEVSIPQMWEFNGRVFATGAKLWELFSNGTFNPLGDLTAVDGPIFISANLNQMLISSAGKLFVWNFAGGLLVAVDMTQFGAFKPTIVKYKDGFFLALIADSNIVFVSNLLDGTLWGTLDAIQVSDFPDFVTSIEIDHGELVMLGRKQSITYFNNGDLNNPFTPNQSAGIIEQGSSALAATCKIDNTLYMLGGDERGELIAYKANGYTPQRVSNHSVETIWQRYSYTADAISFTMQYQGHHWWILTFPTANATWCYDVTTQYWCEWSCTDAHGQQGAFRGRCYCLGFKTHLTGASDSGVVYKMLESAYDDTGRPLIRTRRAPHISVELERVPHQRLQIDIETGLGPMIPLQDGSGQFREPTVSLRWSDDGGHTWSNQHTKGIGNQGQFRKRVIWRRLGAPRDRVYELTCSDPIPLRIIDAHLTAGQAYQPTERLSAQMGKGA